MSPIFRTLPSLEGHVIQSSPGGGEEGGGGEALTTAPSPSPFSPGPTYVPYQVEQTPDLTLRPLSRPLLSIRRGRNLGSPSCFWKSLIFFSSPSWVEQCPPRPRCGGDDE